MVPLMFRFRFPAFNASARAESKLLKGLSGEPSPIVAAVVRDVDRGAIDDERKTLHFLGAVSRDIHIVGAHEVPYGPRIGAFEHDGTLYGREGRVLAIGRRGGEQVPRALAGQKADTQALSEYAGGASLGLGASGGLRSSVKRKIRPSLAVSPSKLR